MVQYILTKSERYSVAELAQMAIEGGCQWITVALPELNDEELKTELMPEVIEMCKESGVILTLEDRPELAAELSVHGVRLSIRYQTEHRISAPELREKIGPEAIIGLEVVDPMVIPTLVKADIDFAFLPQHFTENERTTFIAAVKEDFPIVAQGNITANNAKEILSQGFKGLAVGEAITAAPNPVTATAALINSII